MNPQAFGGFIMMRKIIFGLALACLVCGCTKKQASNVSPGSSAGNEIVIGEYGSMTGGEATFGISTHKGIQLVVDETNAAGGIKGKKIRLISYDDQGKSDDAAAVVKRLITEDKVVAILGEVASSRSLAAAPIAQEAKIPMITPSSTNPKVTEVGDQIFRVCFLDTFQGTAMAKFARENLKLKKIAVFRDMKSDYSLGLAEYFIKTFKELGGEIVEEQTYQANDRDFKAQLTQIRSKKPDGVFIPGYYSEVGLISSQARQLGIKAVFLGGDGWDSPKLHELGKSAIDGGYFSNHFTAESTDPVVQDFVKRYKEKFNEMPDGLGAAGYDAAKVLLDAISRAPDLTPASIRNEIAKTRDYHGVTGAITINEQRNATKSLVVVKVDGAVNRYVTTVNP